MTLDDAIHSLKWYAEKRRPTGQFLEAVLSNDLFDAMARGDPESREVLPGIVSFIYNRMPGNCHGSRAKVRAWLADSAPGVEVER